jgi:hypothetical protein
MDQKTRDRDNKRLARKYDREGVNAYARDWRAANLEHTREYQREYRRKQRAAARRDNPL